jgi:hypothetical protein
MIVISPIMKTETPEAIPASIVSARAGLTTMSSHMVLPADTDLYNEFVNDPPMKNNIGIAIARPKDHQPSLFFGNILIRMLIIFLHLKLGQAVSVIYTLLLYQVAVTNFQFQSHSSIKINP